MRSGSWSLFALVSIASLPATAVYDRSVPSGYVSSLVSSGPERYFSQMNSGWLDEQYASLKARIDPRRSYLVIHNRLPSTPLDLRTPNGFRKSVTDAGIVHLPRLDIGHVMIGWHCEIDGQVHEGSTGITGEQDNQQRAMGKSGWGLTGLFSIFKDGHLQTPLLVGSVLRIAKKEKRPVSTLAFEVEPDQCRRMLDFLRSFLSHENRPYQRFGLNADPLKFEGGGCGSFAASAIHSSGAITEFFPHLWRLLRANPRMFGYGLPSLPAEIEPYPVPRAFGPSYKVPAIQGLLLQNWDPRRNGPSIDIRLMDPELLFLAQQTIFRLSLDDVYRSSASMGRELLASRFVRTRSLKAYDPRWDTETGAGNESELKIDEHLDRQSAGVVQGARRWFRDRKAQGFRAKGFEFNGHPAVLLSR